MKRVLAALFIALLSVAQPASALPQDPAIAQMQATLADVGRWSLEHQSAAQLAAQPLTEIQGFLDILDKFARGEMNERDAVVALEAWRAHALQTIAQARAAATALRAPPSLSAYGPAVANLENALHAARDGLLPTIQELERVVNACVDLGLAAIRDPGKSYELRERALLQAQMQLVRVDLNRLELTAASISPSHPTRALLQAMQNYYHSLILVPQYALAELDGGGDRAALVSGLRQTARDLRGNLARVTALCAQLRTQMSTQFAPDLVRVATQMLDTYPPTVTAYSGLADNIDRAAAAIERGEDVQDIWGEQEEWDAPFLDEIDRLDRMRAQLLADMNGSL